jgi:cobalt-zinc-cadmium resistance protein CzcA
MVVIGGIISSILLTLLVLPVLYAMVGRVKAPVAEEETAVPVGQGAA